MSYSLRASLASVAVVLACLEGGCAPREDSFVTQELDSETQGVDPTEGVQLSDVALELEGAPAGYARTARVDELGRLEVTFIAGEAEPLLDALVASLKGDDVSVDLRVVDSGGDELVVEGATPSELAVMWTMPTSKGAESLATITVAWTAEDVKYSSGNGGVVKGNLSQAPKSTSLDIQGLDPSDLRGFTLKAKRPTKHYGAWDVSGLKTEGSATKASTIKTLVDAGALLPVSFVLVDKTTGTETSATFEATPVSLTEEPLQSTIEWAVEGQIMKIQQKG
ncbi:MAG: hypothetical protein U0271_03535 [Polyangiaceae bacterium]